MHEERKPRSVWFSDEEWADAGIQAAEQDKSISQLFRELIRKRSSRRK